MELSEIRVEIDQIDNEIKDLFIKRMDLAEKIVRIKAETGDAIYKPEREKEIIETLTEDVDPSIKGEYKTVIESILSASKHYQYRRLAELKGDE